MPGFIDLCRHRSHAPPYYASQLNAMQLQRDDLAPWGGWNIRAIYDDDKQPSSLALMH